LEETGAHGKIILKLILKEWHGMAWTGFLELRIGRCVTCCEHRDTASDFVKREKFLTDWVTLSLPKETALRGVSYYKLF